MSGLIQLKIFAYPTEMVELQNWASLKSKAFEMP